MPISAGTITTAAPTLASNFNGGEKRLPLPSPLIIETIHFANGAIAATGVNNGTIHLYGWNLSQSVRTYAVCAAESISAIAAIANVIAREVRSIAEVRVRACASR